MIDILLSYEGELADENQLDFYDAAHALVGFQRTLALSTHMALNGEIIVQAPSLKGASIQISTPRRGSWEVVAAIAIGGSFLASTKAPSQIKTFVTSIIDYAVSQVTGYVADFAKLKEQHEAQIISKDITPSKLDGLSEKIENSVAEMHRPIVASQSADHANIFAINGTNKKIQLGYELNNESWEYIKDFELERNETEIEGVVSSYNVNTYSGRFYSIEERRTIGFELILTSRTIKNMRNITNSLRANAIEQGRTDGAVIITGRRLVTKSKRIRSIKVTKVRAA